MTIENENGSHLETHASTRWLDDLPQIFSSFLEIRSLFLVFSFYINSSMKSIATATSSDNKDEQSLSTVLLKDKIELQVPLAIGTLQWGTTWIDDKIINHSGVLKEETCKEIVSICDGSGITLYDTAEGYGGGTSEKRLGRLLSRNEDCIFMTKFLPAPWRCFHADLERAVRESCRRLQVSSIPIYLLHSPVHWLRDVEYWVESCAACHEKGLIQAMGLSNCNADQVRRAVSAGEKCGVKVVCNQVHYSLLDYNSAALQEMERACRELGVKIVAFSPIGQGLLTDGLTTDKWQHNKPAKMLRLKYDDLQPLRSLLSQLAKKYDKSMAQVSLNWCIRHEVVPLVGCRSPQQARDSMGCLGWSLSTEDVQELDKLALDRSTLESK
jgi:aryl-alcohol dehydrogenase-like predicted oxidoreductase